MDDQDALQLAVAYYNKLSDNSFNLITDLNYKIIAEDPRIAQILNVDSGTLLGKTLVPERSHSPWRTKQVSAILEECKKSKLSSRWLSLRFSRLPKYWLIILTYSPLINQDNDNVIGFRLQGELPDIPLSFYAVEEVINNSIQKKLVEYPQQDPELTNRELEILFLLFNTDNYDSIAALLTLAHNQQNAKSSVAKIIKNILMPKFAVETLEELKATAHRRGYHRKIPNSLFGEFMYPLSKL